MPILAVPLAARKVILSQKYTPNDQRSMTKNPTHPSHEADRINRIEQGHPNPPPAPAPQDAEPKKEG